jgi:predicted MFS family arabinose efflux permease
MLSNKAFTGVGNGVLAASMSRTLHVAEAAAAATAHPAFWAYPGAGAAADITPQRKRRNATATGQSVDRGSI